MTTHDGADAETKVEAMTDEELAEFRALMEIAFDDSTIGVDRVKPILARLDAEAARAKAAEDCIAALRQHAKRFDEEPCMGQMSGATIRHHLAVYDAAKSKLGGK